MPEQKFTVDVEFTSKNKEIFDRANAQAKETAQAAKSLKNAYQFQREELQKLNPELVKQIDLQKQAANATQLQIRNLRAQARELTTTARVMKDSAADWDRIFNPLAAGGAIVTGGIFAAVTKYVSDADNATKATQEWRAAQADLERSGSRVAEVLTRETLPLIQEAAKVTRQIAGFVEAHPEVANFAINAGLITLAVGTVGKAVTSGVRLIADIKLSAALGIQHNAAQLQLVASENQLRAAGIQAGASGTPKTPSGGVGAALNSPLALAGLAAGLVTVNALALKQLDALRDGLNERAQGLGDVVRNKILPIFNLIPGLSLVSGLGNLEDAFESIKKDAPEAGQGLKQLSDSIKFLGGSKENQDAVIKAFGDWKAEDARIVNDAMEARKQIVAEGERAIVDLTRNYTSQRADITSRFNAEAAQITTRFQEESKKAEQDYVNERAEIVRDSAERIREIQQEEQEKREKIERDFAKSARNAARDRDALALQDAQEARDEALAEAGRGTEEAIAKEKRETAARLAELAARYAQERQQRQAQYEADLKENAARRAAALKEAAERYQQELKQARELQAQKLKDAAEAANKERIERRTQFIAQLADLGVTLNSERQLRVNAYNAMLVDLQNWLNQMGGVFTQTASSLGTASGGTAGSVTLNTNPNYGGSGQYGTIHDYSGYATKGVYRMAQDGKPEWVMSGNDTAAAERAIGGQLTQGNVMQMISMMGAMKGAMNYNDNRNFNSGISARQRRDIANDTRDVLQKMLRG